MTVGDIVDFTVGKILDLLGVEHSLATRWEGKHTPARIILYAARREPNHSHRHVHQLQLLP